MIGAKATAALLAALALAALASSPAPAELIGGGELRVAVSAKLTPNRLPRRGSAPIAVTLGARIASSARSRRLPPLRRISFAINRHGHLLLRGLPVCRVGRIQPSTNAEAMRACGPSLVGHGHFSADVKLPEQSPFPSRGRMLAFNGRLRGRPAILAHIYGTAPAASSYVLPFLIRKTAGTYGVLLEASLPHISGDWGNITSMSMTLNRRFAYRGRARSYLSAGCPLPPGLQIGIFPLVRAAFTFAGGRTLTSVLSRSCRVAR